MPFQSHTGSIKSKQSSCYALIDGQGFNPTLVRLKVIKALWLLMESLSFNPTLVRLKDLTENRQVGIFFCFNPTLVRLKVGNTV